MNDFLRRIRRRPGGEAPAPADQPTSVGPAVDAPADGAPEALGATGGAADAEAHDPGTHADQPTEALAPVDGPLVEVHGPAVEGAVPAPQAQAGPVPHPEGVPAGAPAEPEAQRGPSFRERGRLRRRLRFLRRVRELGFRDLGGLVFDQHRFGRINEELVSAKLAALSAVDAELRALAVALDDERPITELREPGVSACPRCGALHGSEARFCPSCGTPFRGPRPVAEVGDVPAGTPAPASEVPVWAAPNPPQ